MINIHILYKYFVYQQSMKIENNMAAFSDYYIFFIPILIFLVHYMSKPMFDVIVYQKRKRERMYLIISHQRNTCDTEQESERDRQIERGMKRSKENRKQENQKLSGHDPNQSRMDHEWEPG